MTPIRRIALVFILLLAGCHHFDYTSVHIDIGSIKSDAGDGDVLFTLNIMNETLYPIVIDEETHKIYLNGTLIGEGTNKDSFGLPKLKITPREVRVHLANAAAAEAVQDAINRGGTYRIETRFVTNARDDRDKMTTTSTGQLSLGSN